MNRFLASLVVSALAVGCVSVSSAPTSAGHVIVPGRQLPDTLGLQFWTPAEEDVQGCQRALAYTLRKQGRDLAQYNLRLGGVMRDGKRHIVGMAADKDHTSPHFLRASDEVIVLHTFGGGKLFFDFDYDVENGKLVKLDFNAAL